MEAERKINNNICAHSFIYLSTQIHISLYISQYIYCFRFVCLIYVDTNRNEKKSAYSGFFFFFFVIPSGIIILFDGVVVCGWCKKEKRCLLCSILAFNSIFIYFFHFSFFDLCVCGHSFCSTVCIFVFFLIIYTLYIIFLKISPTALIYILFYF